MWCILQGNLSNPTQLLPFIIIGNIYFRSIILFASNCEYLCYAFASIQRQFINNQYQNAIFFVVDRHRDVQNSDSYVMTNVLIILFNIHKVGLAFISIYCLIHGVLLLYSIPYNETGLMSTKSYLF